MDQIEWPWMSSYVACIYASVKGRLDKMDPSKITQARKELREHVKFTQQPRLANLHIKGSITQETGAKLNDAIGNFMSSWPAGGWGS